MFAHALALLFLLATASPPKPLNGYGELIVDNVAVVKTCEFSPAQSELLRRSLVTKLRGRKTLTIFEVAEAAKHPRAENVKRVIVTSTVLSFDAGSRTARALGIGAGATKLRVRFVFKDIATGREILTIERIGRYSGRFSGEGATNDAAFSASASEVVDGIAQEIEKNR